MIQERSWRGEWDNDGNLCGDIDEVDSIPRKPGGKHVGYVMAKSKEEASSKLHAMAKDWADKFRARKRGYCNQSACKDREAKENTRLCRATSCKALADDGFRLCKKHRDRSAAGNRRSRAGERIAPVPMSPTELRLRKTEHDRSSNEKKKTEWGSLRASQLYYNIRLLDTDPAALRRRWVEQLIQSGGAIASARFDEYERERAKQHADALDDAVKRYEARTAEAAE